MHLGYWEFKPWDAKSRLVFDSPSSLYKWKKSFFFVSGTSFSFLFLFTFLLISIDLLCFTWQSIHDPI